MVRLLGMLAIFTASSVMGFIMAGELNERTKVLKEIYQSAIHIKSELEYRGADIKECFNRRGELFRAAYKYLQEYNLLPCEALKKACDETKCLKEEDRAAIYTYADKLDAEDLGGQIANVKLFLENLRQCIKSSEDEYQLKNRLYKSGGTIAGLGFIILLL